MQGFKSLTQKRENIFFIALTQKRKQSIGLLFSFLKRCVPHAERDAHYVRDDGFVL